MTIYSVFLNIQRRPTDFQPRWYRIFTTEKYIDDFFTPLFIEINISKFKRWLDLTVTAGQNLSLIVDYLLTNKTNQQNNIEFLLTEIQHGKASTHLKSPTLATRPENLFFFPMMIYLSHWLYFNNSVGLTKDQKREEWTTQTRAATIQSERKKANELPTSSLWKYTDKSMVCLSCHSTFSTLKFTSTLSINSTEHPKLISGLVVSHSVCWRVFFSCLSW